MKLKDIANHIDGTLIGDEYLDFSSLASLHDATASDLSFCLEKKYLTSLDSSKAGAIISFQECGYPNQIIVKHSRKALSLVIHLLYNSLINDQATPYISSPENPIASSAHIHSNVNIGSYTTIGNNTVIDSGTNIGANCHIGRHCQIGKNCIIHPGVTLYDSCQISDNVIIHSGTVLGTDGYGFYNENHTWHKIPHIGKVTIGSEVEIGANCTIDRGCLGKTIIGKGTKLDNLVHIAHNAIIGEHCAITAQVGCLGGTTIENHVQVGGQTGIASVTIGEHSIVAARSGVTRSIPANSMVSGFPAWDHKSEIKKEATIRKLIKK